MLIQDSTLKMIVDGIYTVEAVARTHRTHPQKVREALTDYKQRQATLDHLASLQDRDAAPTQKHILDGLNDCVKILENVSTSVSERLEAAFAVPEVERADESAKAEKQRITELLKIQALFDSWGVKLEPCNTTGADTSSKEMAMMPFSSQSLPSKPSSHCGKQRLRHHGSRKCWNRQALISRV